LILANFYLIAFLPHSLAEIVFQAGDEVPEWSSVEEDAKGTLISSWYLVRSSVNVC
jgi:hypothetical protein